MIIEPQHKKIKLQQGETKQDDNEYVIDVYQQDESVMEDVLDSHPSVYDSKRN